MSKINLQGVERVFLFAANPISPTQAKAMADIFDQGVKRITVVPCSEEIRQHFHSVRQGPAFKRAKIKFIKINKKHELEEMFCR